MMNRKDMLIELCNENNGRWADGTLATEVAINAAANDPMHFGIDPDVLDGACNGDVTEILELRKAWGLPAFA